jgi:hypothetical protein
VVTLTFRWVFKAKVRNSSEKLRFQQKVAKSGAILQRKFDRGRTKNGGEVVSCPPAGQVQKVYSRVDADVGALLLLGIRRDITSIGSSGCHGRTDSHSGIVLVVVWGWRGGQVSQGVAVRLSEGGDPPMRSSACSAMVDGANLTVVAGQQTSGTERWRGRTRHERKERS